MTEMAVKTSKVVVPHQANWPGRAAARALYVLVRMVAGSVRFGLSESEEARATLKAGPVIFCTWHNRLALSLSLHRRFLVGPTRPPRLAAMVSASKDGAFLAHVLECFGVQPVRGSSSRRGPQALLELTSWIDSGYDVAITPDGPRGPCYTVQDGVIALAQLTGRPILPVLYSLNWKFCLKSWDRFQVPMPFARCEVVLGSPMTVPRETPDSERARFRAELEAQMRGMTRD